MEFDAARHRIPTPPKVEVDPASIKVAVASSGEDLAGIAAATRERLSNAKPSADGFVSCGSSRVLSCSLSPATVARACRILNAIERALPSVGARFVHDQEKKRVDIDINGERMSGEVVQREPVRSAGHSTPSPLGGSWLPTTAETIFKATKHQH